MSDYLSIPAAALRVGVTEHQLRQAFANGDLPPLRRVGRYYVLDEDDLRRAVEFFGGQAGPGDLTHGVLPGDGPVM